MQNFYVLGLQIPTILVVLSIILVWFRRTQAWQLAYFVTLIVALATKAITYPAFLCAFMILVFSLIYQRQNSLSLLALVALLSVGVALGLHVIPGFNNHEFAQALKLNETSGEFDIWFNYDKSMFGVLVLGFLFHDQLIRSWSEFKRVVSLIALPVLIGIPLIYLFALLMTYSRFDFTPSALFWPWVLKNLFFTVLAEELLFRGLIQAEIEKRLQHKHAAEIALMIAAILFGLAHFAGGFEYIILATVAGILYGYTYKITGRIEAPIITHLLLNSAHFIFFAYPYSIG